MRKIIEVNKKNLSRYYWKLNGNLYYKYPEDKDYQVLDGFTLEDCKNGLRNKIKFIWIEGDEI